MAYNRYQRTFLFIVFYLVYGSVYAIKDVSAEKKTTLAANTSVEAIDIFHGAIGTAPLFTDPNWNLKYKQESAYGLIEFGVDESNDAAQDYPYTVSVTLDIEYWTPRSTPQI